MALSRPRREGRAATIPRRPDTRIESLAGQIAANASRPGRRTGATELIAPGAEAAAAVAAGSPLARATNHGTRGMDRLAVALAAIGRKSGTGSFATLPLPVVVHRPVNASSCGPCTGARNGRALAGEIATGGTRTDPLSAVVTTGKILVAPARVLTEVARPPALLR